jgi:hypothetical protein
VRIVSQSGRPYKAGATVSCLRGAFDQRPFWRLVCAERPRRRAGHDDGPRGTNAGRLAWASVRECRPTCTDVALIGTLEQDSTTNEPGGHDAPVRGCTAHASRVPDRTSDEPDGGTTSCGRPERRLAAPPASRVAPRVSSATARPRADTRSSSTPTASSSGKTATPTSPPSQPAGNADNSRGPASSS